MTMTAPPKAMQALALGSRSWLNIAFNGIRGLGISHGVAVRDVPVPSISPTELLVEVYAVTCNPTDVGHIDFVGPAHSIIGCDYSGVVKSVGSQAPGNWKVGDRIAGTVHGGLYPDKGAFAEYLKVEGDLAWKPPVHLTHPEAATYGISAVTAMQGLYTQLDVPWPDLHAAGRALAGSTPIESTEKKQVLIYAGSTGASLYAIQLAKLAGYEVVTTCSPHNFELVKRYGADAVFDYHSPTALDEIRTQYPKLSRAFDGISLSESTTFCAKAVERESGKVVVLLDTRKAGKGTSAEIRWILMYTLLGKPFGFFWPIGPKWGVAEDDRKALVKFYALLPRLVEKVKPIPVKVIEGGFEGLETALDMLRKKKVSGTKVAVQFVGDQ